MIKKIIFRLTKKQVAELNEFITEIYAGKPDDHNAILCQAVVYSPHKVYLECVLVKDAAAQKIGEVIKANLGVTNDDENLPEMP